MAPAVVSSSITPSNPGGQLHPSLLGIVNTMQKVEQQREERLGIVQEFFELTDSWAKSKGEKQAAAVVATLMEKITPITTAFAVDQAEATNFPSKKPPIMASTLKPAAPRNHIVIEDNGHSLPPKPQGTRSIWAIVVGKAAKLLSPPSAQVPRRPVPTSHPKARTTSKEDKRLFLRLRKDHQWHKLSLVTIKKIITDKAGIVTSAITSMYSVRSGIAL